MNENPEIVTATLTPGRSTWPLWKRSLLGVSVMVALAIGSWCYWIFGMLMFAFSLDGARSSDVPDWIEPFMLLGWGGILAATVLIPSTLFICGISLKRCMILQACLLAISIIAPVAAWIATMVAISN